MALAQWEVWIEPGWCERLTLTVTSPAAKTPHPRDCKTAEWAAKRAALPKFREIDPTLKLADIAGARCKG